MKRPLTVTVTWTDAQHDNTFECALKDVAKRVTLMYGRTHTGHLVHVDAEKIVLAFGLDPAEAHEDGEPWVSEFLAIPLGWVTKVTTTRGRVIYRQTT